MLFIKKAAFKAEKSIPAGRMSEYEEKKGRHTFRRLLSYFKYYKFMTAASLFLAAYGNMVDLVKPLIFMYIIDNNLVPGRNDVHEIMLFALLYVAVVISGLVAGIVQTMTMSILGQRIMHRLRTGLFSHIQRLNLQFFDRNSSGSILTRVSSDVEELSALYMGMFVTLVKQIILIITLIVIMLKLSWRMALFSFAVMPLVFIIALLYRNLARKNFILTKGVMSKLNGFLAENIIGMKIVQIFGREKQKKDEFIEINNECYRLNVIEATLNALGNPLISAIAQFTIVLMLAFFANRILNGSIKIGVITAFTAYIKQLYAPIASIAQAYTTLASGMISADRIFDIIDNTKDLEDLESGIIPEKLFGEIEFDHVWFAYNEENWVLKDISFHVEPGQRVAFVGATGSGKTTIISLLARFYDIQKGRILIDGRDIKEYNLTFLRQQISVVMQDVFLFSGDIRYNIRLNREDITDEQIRAAAQAVNASGFIERLPGGYAHEVAERGADFSAGQRQLIAFARAVAFNPSVLVLDEATANIDVETELAIQSALETLSRNRTSIYIAHRLSTIVDCDNIFVLHRGVLRERGNHAQLISQNGIYAKLYELSLKSAKPLDEADAVMFDDVK